MNKPQLCPEPRYFSWENDTGIISPSYLLYDQRLSPVFARALFRFQLKFACLFDPPLPGLVGNESVQSRRPAVSFQIESANFRKQEYRIVADETGIYVLGGSEEALFHALQTITQIFRICGRSICRFQITDWPDYENRGFMLDVSRCKVPSQETLFEQIDHLAELKYNQLQLYVEHTFAFSAHERVWINASPFTPKEIRDIDRYCEDRYIQLVPNLNSFGHLGRWLKHPEYSYLAECPDGFDLPDGTHRPSGVIAPCEQSLEFIGSLYEEYLPNFSAGLMNIGCDETYELGLGRSREQCEAKGKHRVYLDFLKGLANLAGGFGRTAMFWGDIILQAPELIPELPGNLIALNWGYTANHPYAEQTACFAASRIPFYVCPGTASWLSLSGKTSISTANILNALENGLKNGASGMLLTDWGDGGHHQYPPVSWPGMTFAAACAWCLEANKALDIASAIDCVWSHDATGETGRYLMDLGRLADIFQNPWPNGTCYGHGLIDDLENDPPFFHNTTIDELHNLTAAMHEFDDRLGSLKPKIATAGRVLAQLENTNRMIKAAAGRLLAARKVPQDMSALRLCWMKAIESHQQLWLQENRIGGLHESSAAMLRVLETLY